MRVKKVSYMYLESFTIMKLEIDIIKAMLLSICFRRRKSNLCSDSATAVADLVKLLMKS